MLIDLVHEGFFRERCGLGLDVTELARDEILGVMISLSRGNPDVINVVHSPDGKVTSRSAYSASSVGSTTAQQSSGLILIAFAKNKSKTWECCRVVVLWHRCDVVGGYHGLVGREGCFDLILQTARISPGAIVRVAGEKVGVAVIGNPSEMVESGKANVSTGRIGEHILAFGGATLPPISNGVEDSAG